MPLQATSGAASYDAFGGGVVAEPNYIESCFSTYLYTGNGSTQTITNGIDLSGKGGLVWWKNRTNGTGHGLIDTTRGIDYYLSSNTTDAQDGPVSYISSVSSTGYSIGAGTQFVNQSANNYASWTFRKQPKFFDVVTYTGDGTTSRAISHSLTSTPGCIIVKRTDNTGAWYVYHRGVDPTLAYGYFMVLNTTAARAGAPAVWDVAPTSTNFTVQPDTTNISGATYVAYLFAHDAGGFGLTGTDNVISCGSATATAGTWTDVNVGFEPQWVLIKNSTATGAYNASGSAGSQDWYVIDTMRGATAATGTNTSTVALSANSSIAEYNDVWFGLTSTGFSFKGVVSGSDNFIYIAIRRGPMKVPTSGTSVFAPVTGTTDANFGFPADFVIFKNRDGTSGQPFFTRLLDYKYLNSSNTFAEGGSSGDAVWNASQTTFSQALTGASSIFEGFRRAPSFFDVVCYTGTGSATTFTHNLGVAPELMIVKMRSATSATGWIVYAAPLANAATSYLVLNSTDAVGTGNTVLWNSTAPTSSVFSLGASSNINTNGATNVAYLFASCPNVSKVTTFTGNGSSQTINCGFTSGARFVMIKRVDSTGNWTVFDTARGISSGNDPALYLNSTAAEVTGVDAIDPDSTGFIVNQESTFNLNVSSATYLVLAIA